MRLLPTLLLTTLVASCGGSDDDVSPEAADASSIIVAADDSAVVPGTGERLRLPSAGGSSGAAAAIVLPGMDDAPEPEVEAWTATGRVVDGSGEGLASVRVRARDRATGAPLGETSTDASGAFELAGLSVPSAALEIDPESLPSGVIAPAGTDVVRRGDEPAGYGATLAESGGDPALVQLTVPALVIGTLREDGAPVDAALVRAVSRVPGFERVKVLGSVGRDGAFELALVPGPYELQALIAGAGDAPDRTHRLAVEAEPGAVLRLGTIEIGEPAPEEAPGERVADAGTPDTHASTAAPATSPEGEAVVAGEEHAAEEAELIPLEGGVDVVGRVISAWGEPVDGVEIVARGDEGEVIRRDWTDERGEYELPSLPPGELRIELAPGLPVGKTSDDGIVLRERPEPLVARTFEGQERVTLEDAVVDVQPIFRVSGRIDVDPDAFAAFKRHLEEQVRGLDDERLLRAYLRGMRLTQRNVGGKGAGRPIAVKPDGRFTWSCNLPAEDVLLVLEPRSARPGPGYRGPVGVKVTPAGVRTARLKIAYPPKDEPGAAPESR